MKYIYDGWSPPEIYEIPPDADSVPIIDGTGIIVGGLLGLALWSVIWAIVATIIGSLR